MADNTDDSAVSDCDLEAEEDIELRAEMIIQCLRCTNEDCTVRMTTLKPYLEAKKFVDEHVAH